MTVPLSEAKSRLDELIAQLQPGEELVLTDGANHPVARLRGEARPLIPRLGSEFPRLRHYSAAPVCVAVAGVCWAVFGLVGWEPLVGFVCGLFGSVVSISAAFSIAYGEDE